MIIISTSLTVSTQPSPRFRVEAWLPFRNREMDYTKVAATVNETVCLNLTKYFKPLGCAYKSFYPGKGNWVSF